MKKYFMLVITTIMIFITIALYINEKRGPIPQYKQPYISIDSQKFGTIKCIKWTTKYLNPNKSLIILSSRNTAEGPMSYIYNLDIDTGKSEELAKFPPHKNLNNELYFNGPMESHYIAAAYDKGIIKINYNNYEPDSFPLDQMEIEGFETANSMDLKGNIIYTRENDNLLYSMDLFQNNIMDFNNTKNQKFYYTKPLSIVNLNSLNKIISYTSFNNNSIDLFVMDFQSTVKSMMPLIKNVVIAKGIDDSMGFAGMNINNKKLNVFLIRGTIDKFNNDDYYSLDTFENNTDTFGAVPSIDAVTNNKDFSLVYTSYDENHKGSLNLCTLNQQPKIIVNDENIFGPVTIKETFGENNSGTYILYFTSEGTNTKFKVCDVNGNLYKDITDMVLSSN